MSGFDTFQKSARLGMMPGEFATQSVEFGVRSTDVVHTAETIDGFDVQPDGTRLVVEVAQRQEATVSEGSARGQVMVVLNWLSSPLEFHRTKTVGRSSMDARFPRGANRSGVGEILR